LISDVPKTFSGLNPHCQKSDLMRRTLVVGSGSIARRHIANLRALWPDGEVACVSASGRKIEAGETKATTLLQALEEALDWKPEFAVIASPAPLHLKHAARLVTFGIPVLIEKPVSHTLEGQETWISQLEEHAARIDVAYNLRLLPSAQQFKRGIEDGLIGRVMNVLVDVGQYLPDWRPQDNYRKGVSARRELGGGALLELSHEFDYLRWFFGGFDNGFCHASTSGSLELDVEDRADVILSHPDGLVANVHMDFLQRYPRRTCKAIGEEGSLIWNPIANSVTLATREGERQLYAEPGWDRNLMYQDLLRHFAMVARGEAEPLVGFHHALDTLRLVELLKLSAATGRAVAIEEKHP